MQLDNSYLLNLWLTAASWLHICNVLSRKPWSSCAGRMYHANVGENDGICHPNVGQHDPNMPSSLSWWENLRWNPLFKHVLTINSRDLKRLLTHHPWEIRAGQRSRAYWRRAIAQQYPPISKAQFLDAVRGCSSKHGFAMVRGTLTLN